MLNRVVGFPTYILNWITCKRKHVCMGVGCRINGILKVHGNGIVYIGNNVKINSSERSNPIGGMINTVFSIYSPAILDIADNVGMSNCAIVSRCGVKIGQYTKIGGGVRIYDTDFHSLQWQDRREPEKDRMNCISEKISIGSDCFIGAESIILKGVTIGDRSIIAAGSIVTRDVPSDQVWAGVPARYVRDIVTHNTIEKE